MHKEKEKNIFTLVMTVFIQVVNQGAEFIAVRVLLWIINLTLHIIIYPCCFFYIIYIWIHEYLLNTVNMQGVLILFHNRLDYNKNLSQFIKTHKRYIYWCLRVMVLGKGGVGVLKRIKAGHYFFYKVKFVFDCMYCLYCTGGIINILNIQHLHLTTNVAENYEMKNPVRYMKDKTQCEF